MQKQQDGFNIYKDRISGRQLSETVEEFLARLPPSSSKIEDCGPWIYISNPAYDPNKDREDLRHFKENVTAHLTGFEEQKLKVEESTEQAPKSVRTRKVNELRDELQAAIFRDARKYRVTAGKWMLFPRRNEVDRIWGAIAHATAAGDLGHAAKVASDDGSGDQKSRLICVYNEDCEDRHAVKRVLRRLGQMGFVERDRSIYYKADAYSHLEINAGNSWGLKASLYASKDALRDGWEDRRAGKANP